MLIQLNKLVQDLKLILIISSISFNLIHKLGFAIIQNDLTILLIFEILNTTFVIFNIKK